MKTWIWNDIHLQLPDDWEMLLFSKNPASGKCTFADRYQYRLQVCWQELENEPEIDKMVTEYRLTLKEDQSIRSVTRKRLGDWLGLTYKQSGKPTARYAYYFQATKKLIEVIMPPADEADAFDHAEVLHSIAIKPPEGKEPRDWCAFGLNAKTPANLLLQQCEVLPARVRMTWASGQKKQKDLEIVIQRLGMVHRWLKGEISDWLKIQLPTEAKILDSGQIHMDRHTVERMSGKLATKGMKRLRSKSRIFEANAWLCPEDNRLYSIATYGDEQQFKETPASSRQLSCCPAMKGLCGIN